MAAIADSVCIAFVATIPKSQAGSSRGVRRRPHAPDDLARPGEPEPVRVDRVDVRAVEVVRPHLDVVELREVRREQRADGAAPDDADPHSTASVGQAADAAAAADAPESSRPPVSPLGRRIRTSGHERADDDDPRPRRHLDRAAEDVDARSRRSRAPSRARSRRARRRPRPRGSSAPPITSIASVMKVRSR